MPAAPPPRHRPGELETDAAISVSSACRCIVPLKPFFFFSLWALNDIRYGRVPRPILCCQLMQLEPPDGHPGLAVALL